MHRIIAMEDADVQVTKGKLCCLYRAQHFTRKDGFYGRTADVPKVPLSGGSGGSLCHAGSSPGARKSTAVPVCSATRTRGLGFGVNAQCGLQSYCSLGKGIGTLEKGEDSTLLLLVTLNPKVA